MFVRLDLLCIGVGESPSLDSLLGNLHPILNNGGVFVGVLGGVESGVVYLLDVAEGVVPIPPLSHLNYLQVCLIHSQIHCQNNQMP